MLKKILELEGTTELTRAQKQIIKGGIACHFAGDPVCIAGHHCVGYDEGGEGHCEQIKS